VCGQVWKFCRGRDVRPLCICLVCGQTWKFCRGRDVAIAFTTMYEQIFPLSQYCVIVDIQTIASEAQDHIPPACCIRIHPSCARTTN